MSMTLMLALQTAAIPASPPPLLDIDFDLSRYSRVGLGLGRSACRRDDPTAIVVCARRSGGDYPLERMARIYGPEAPLVAETRLVGNLVGGVRVEAKELDRGAVSNRVLIGLRLPF